MSGAEPWIGSYRPNRPCAVRRSPSDADGSMPRLPARTAASSERMSPNRFSVTRTSNDAGRRTSSIAHESTSWWLTSTSGYSERTSSTTTRHRREVASTLALSTLVRRPRRPRASSNASRTTRRISPSVYQSVSIPTRPSGVSRCSDGRPKYRPEVSSRTISRSTPSRISGSDGRGRDEGGQDRNGPQVGEQLEAATEREQRLLGSHAGGGVVPARPADRAEEHRVARRRPRPGPPAETPRHTHRSPRRPRRRRATRSRTRRAPRPRPARPARQR